MRLIRYKSERTFQQGGDELTEIEYVRAVRRNSQRIFLIAFSYVQNKENAEDIMQNTFLKLWKSTTVFEDENHIDKWLTRVCANECKDSFKSLFVKSTPLDEIAELSDTDSYYNIDLFNAVSSLPKKERLAIHLFYYEDMKIDEISQVMKTKPGTVKSLLFRARQKLKAKLGDEWTDE